MAHDSYHCRNEELLRVSALQVFPFPTKRGGKYYVGMVGRAENEADTCPEACRPANHKDWESC